MKTFEGWYIYTDSTTREFVLKYTKKLRDQRVKYYKIRHIINCVGWYGELLSGVRVDWKTQFPEVVAVLRILKQRTNGVDLRCGKSIDSGTGYQLFYSIEITNVANFDILS